jgi:hypothetical protein
MEERRGRKVRFERRPNPRIVPAVAQRGVSRKALAALKTSKAFAPAPPPSMDGFDMSELEQPTHAPRLFRNTLSPFKIPQVEGSDF